MRPLIIATVVLSILIGLTGCGVQVTETCSQVSFSYPSGAPPGITYLAEVYVKGSTTVIGKRTGPVDVTGGMITVPLSQSYPTGTQFTVEYRVEIYIDPIGSFELWSDSLTTNACAAGSSVESWFDPGDARINRQAYAGAAVYCDAAEQRVGIYGVNQDNAQGFPAIFIPYDQLPPVPSADEGHTLIASYGNIRFYRLTTGEYQINVGPDAEGKEYVAVWDGCPQTVVKSYIFQSGTQTMTEIYPHE